MEDNLRSLMGKFEIDGEPVEIIKYGQGHINDTYRVTTKLEDGQSRRYILQRINHSIFKEPVKLMDNIKGVTEHIRRKIRLQGGNPEKECLHVVNTKEGSPYLLDKGLYFRCYDFIEGARTYQQVDGPMDFHKSGQALARFQELLSDYDGRTLHETIADFHNTERRFTDFRKTVEEDPLGRASACRKEIDFFLERKDDTRIINGLILQGALPIRVTHNDTKYNNVMIDDETREAVCLVDLDTVMPGVSLYDFGDSIRSGATTAMEDEKDLSKVSFDLSLFRAYTKGYLSSSDFLTETEKSYLPFSAKIMTYECGMRFLKDYLEGDIYYKIGHEHHNLDRARNQMKLVLDMERDYQQMIEIVRESI